MRHHDEMDRRRDLAPLRRVAWTLAVCAAAALGGAARTALAQSGETGALTGTVEDGEGHGLASAEVVVLDGAGQRAVTDDEGTFFITRVPLGTVRQSVRRLGYRHREVSAFVGRARSARSIRIVLEQLPQQIAAVEVKGKRERHTGPMADFYQRLESHANGGYFFTREQIDSMRPSRTTDILRRVPGFTFAAGAGADRGGADRVLRSRDRRCSPLIWIDGTPATTAYYDPDLINPRTIEGIEVYSGVATVPSLLMGPAGAGSCGAVAIWTREGERAGRRADRGEREEAAATLAALVDSVQVYTEAEVDRVAQFEPTARFAPEYPAELRRNKVTGVVVTEFVVDAAGKIEPTTLGVVYSPDPLFTEAVSVALSEVRFTPAIRRGHPVRQLVQLPVHFVEPVNK
jgi:TonB family protein